MWRGFSCAVRSVETRRIFRLLNQLDDAFRSAVEDDGVKVIVLGGEGKHFSSGHGLGTPR
jgi:hypothetical protein